MQPNAAFRFFFFFQGRTLLSLVFTTVLPFIKLTAYKETYEGRLYDPDEFGTTSHPVLRVGRIDKAPFSFRHRDSRLRGEKGCLYTVSITRKTGALAMMSLKSLQG